MAANSPQQFENSVYKNNIAWPLASWQTRLVKLLPGNLESDLECELHVVDIIAQPGMGLTGQYRIQEYEAVSYSWGITRLTAQICCNAQQTSIPLSLFKALQGLRLQDDARWLWCDALCINQDDPVEKSAQVSRMLEIFRKSSRVVAWLGEIQEDTQEAFAAIENVARRVRAAPNSGDYPRASQAEVNRIQSAVDILSKRQWCRRTWVRQEVWANSNLVLKCGFLETPFSSFQTLISNAKAPMYLTILSEDYSRAANLGQDKPKSSPQAQYSIQLRSLLTSGGVFEATDDRDRIFALIGMLRDWTHDREGRQLMVKPILPDYTKDLNQVYQYLTKFCINSEKSLDCLTNFSIQHTCPDLPSWVLDWRQPGTGSYMEPDHRLNDEHRSTSAEKQSFDRTGELVLNGVALGVLGHDAGKSSLLDHVQITIEGGKFINAQYKRNSLAISVAGTNHAYAYAGCWVPPTSMMGDVVVLLNGGSLPFVLRPAEALNGHYWIGAGAFWCFNP